MTIAQRVSLACPRVSAGAAVGVERESTLAAGRRKNHDATARSAASARVIQSAVVRRDAFCSKGCRSCQQVGANNNDSAPGCSSAGLVVAVRIVPRPRPTAAAHRHSVDRGGKRRSTLATNTQIRIPGVAAKASCSTIAAATTSGIFGVADLIRVGATAAAIPRRSARAAPVGTRRSTGIASRRLYVGATRFHPQRCSGNPFPLHRIDAILHCACVSRWSRVNIVRVVTAHTALQLQTRTTTKAQSIHRHRRAVQRQRPRDIQNQNAARGAVPRARRQSRTQRCTRVLRHHNYLICALSCRG